MYRRAQLFLTLAVLAYLHITDTAPPAADLGDANEYELNLDIEEHAHHLASIAKFKCQTPQPRIIQVEEFLSDSLTEGKSYFPETTLLHRCDYYAGSCSVTGQCCGPAVEEPVRLPFVVTFLQDVGRHKKGSWSIEFHKLLNHTVCTCRQHDM